MKIDALKGSLMITLMLRLLSIKRFEGIFFTHYFTLLLLERCDHKTKI